MERPRADGEDGEGGDDESVEEIDPAFYNAGGVSFSEEEKAALGDLQNKRVLLIGAGNGEDAASLSNMGGDLTVLDEVDSLVQVKALAQAASLPLRFVEGSTSRLPKALRDGRFDVVYSGFGALGWIDNLDSWADGVRDALERGGLLLVYDEHPFAFVLAEQDGHLAVGDSYFGKASEDDDDDSVRGDDEDETGGPVWTLGEIVTAVGSRGLAIDLLTEMPESNRFVTLMDEFEDVAKSDRARIPAVFLLRARRL